MGIVREDEGIAARALESLQNDLSWKKLLRGWWKNWSVTEGELNAYLEGDGHQARGGTEEAEEHLDSSSDAASSSHQHYGYTEPPRYSSAQEPYYDHAMYDSPAWNPDPRWG
ncbi:hypothetical protein QYE76_017977 [Lolium multiflorum]|uniref:Uncharacterized protein n=1 Tax=Lolium multiflorum TaxID=4521 RepID=A0AAD8PJ87_LOLMU|nr:hypothetical protein QYE76_017977 [Lolium multiflorum]